jgi:putative phage-type endonuclease
MAISEENRKARSSRIGSSDAPTVMGCNPYKQPLELWREKTGLVEAPDLDGKMAIIMGNALERPIAEVWAKQRGVTVYEDTTSYICPEWDRAVSHIDMRIKEEPTHIVEVKCRGPRQAKHYGPSGGDGGDVMPYDYVQCQHHMMAGQWDVAYLVAYLGGHDLRWYEIERDDAYIERLLSVEKKFWALVESGEQPALDLRHPTSSALIKDLYPAVDDDQIVELGNHGQSLHEEVEKQKAIIRKAQESEKLAKLALQELVGEAELGVLPNGGCYRRKEVSRKGYEVAAKTFVEFRFNKKVPV